MLPLWTTLSGIAAATFLFASGAAHAAAQSASLLQETLGVIRTNLPGISVAELDRTAAQALVNALSPRVRWATPNSTNNSSGPAISKIALHDGDIGYVRVARVDAGFPKALRQACDDVLKTNRLQGLVMDLRYAGGESYAAIVPAADLFLSTVKPLLDWGEGMANSQAKTTGYTFPTALLINGETEGAAEALAAVFRNSGIGLLIGSPTAGRAAIYREFKLSDGERLWLAKTLRLGNGSELPLEGLKPDILAQVHPETERLFYADAFSAPRAVEFGDTNGVTVASTNRARRFRISEADLVRERREGFDPAMLGASEPERPIVRDPALARALDVLKGLAVVRQAKPDFRN